MIPINVQKYIIILYIIKPYIKIYYQHLLGFI